MLAFTAPHGCQSREGEADRAPQAALATAESGPATTIARVQDAPGRFLGQRVRVTGKIDEVLSDHAFELEDTDWAFGDDIIVLTGPAIPLALRAFGRDDELIVTGTVRRFINTAEDIESELRLSFSPELEVRLKARTLLLADSIRKVGDVPSTGDQGQDPAVGLRPTIKAVKAAPESYHGKPLRLAGEVDEILSDRAFELEGTGWAFGDDIIVLTKTPAQFSGGPLVRDSEVIVSGTVRRYVKQEIERDLGWGFTPVLEVRVKDRPVIVADSIRLIDDHGRDDRWSADPAK
ncbi:MAG: hypothetical protein H0T76_12200 [Nannocystis sp.]|nr:hypothetical protein [Nannocystis sp.]MBA3547239.1 hypothetical protein [Nannocystis sp.]